MGVELDLGAVQRKFLVPPG